MVVSQPVSNAIKSSSFTDSCTSTSCWRMFFISSSLHSAVTTTTDSQTSISLATSKNHWQCLASSPPKPAIILVLSFATNTNCRQRVFYIRLLLARQSCATPCTALHKCTSKFAVRCIHKLTLGFLDSNNNNNDRFVWSRCAGARSMMMMTTSTMSKFMLNDDRACSGSHIKFGCKTQN